MSNNIVAELDSWLDNSNDRTTAIERRVVLRARDEIVRLRRDCSALADWAVPTARAEALEEAARICEGGYTTGSTASTLKAVAAAIRALKGAMSEPRFTVRWCRGRGSAFALAPGFAVFDDRTRITITWRSFSEACRHRDRIAQIYAENGW